MEEYLSKPMTRGNWLVLALISFGTTLLCYFAWVYSWTKAIDESKPE